MSGAISPGEVKGILLKLGFQDIVIAPKKQSEEIIREWHVGEGAEKVVFSAYIKASKPENQAELDSDRMIRIPGEEH